MGQQQSKDELLCQQVNDGNVDAIKALCREGARLEWIDKEGKTPLIVACMDPRLYIVAKTLIELGANINAYRPGRHAGTPLHHAAKRGLDQTVKLLLSHGANAFIRNDDCQMPLDVARAKGYNNVVRTLEDHICYFTGHIREILGPGFLEALAPQLLSRKIWAAVVPCSPLNSRRPPKLELVLYPSPQDPHPRTVIALWKCKITEPKFHQSDPALIIFDESKKTRYKFGSAIEGDKQQLRRLYNACKGTPQVVPSSMATVAGTSGLNSHPNSAPDRTNGWGNTSSAAQTEWGSPSGPSPSNSSTSGWADRPSKEECNGWGMLETNPTQPANEIPTPPDSAPSAPPLPDDVIDGPVSYPLIDSSPVDLSAPKIQTGSSETGDPKEKPEESMCVVCWESPIEGACIPCGHMAGCMSCLKEIKSKNGLCPVCRAKIEQVVRLYAV